MVAFNVLEKGIIVAVEVTVVGPVQQHEDETNLMMGDFDVLEVGIDKMHQ